MLPPLVLVALAAAVLTVALVGTGPAATTAPREQAAGEQTAASAAVEPGEVVDESADATDASGTQEPTSSADGERAEEAPVRERLVINHVGDVNLDPSYVPALGAEGPDAVWAGVRDVLRDADLTAVNLECPVGPGGEAQDKQFVFRCDPAALPAMRDAGVDLATLANNHAGDYGIATMLSSVDEVERAGIAAVGVGPDEASAHEPALLELGGWTVAVLGFGGVVPEPHWIAYGDAPGQATGYDAERMAASVAAAAEQADVVVVSVHWGAEGALEPRPEDRRKAEAMIAAGADVVFGHHAHRLQPVERVDDASVFWNLGNFVWPRFSDDGARTAIAQWTLEPDGTTRACLLPAEIDAVGVPWPTDAPPECV
ncbi:CapA family protein [Egicoccus halophilus]|uniref:Capsule synthesis protein CapA domain-containing protein n=1 Tax=Egicoccus halophilus TaxID=1670830 RepID=A0A8J3ACL6_9ACTN|nr:CapA family protein [Egicoccus halophilus]GGI04403.1 hypothetical protein GCM10011354_08920 [Egicoccus halophilus]